MAYGTYTNSGSVQLNAGILGGIVTGSEAGEFLGFPVSGTAINTTAVGVEAWITAGGPKRQLSSSFEGFTGSLIQSLNFLKASIASANDAAGESGEVQFNASDEFDADSTFTFDDTAKRVNVNALTSSQTIVGSTDILAAGGIIRAVAISGTVAVSGTVVNAKDLNLGGVAVGATAAEINLLDSVSAGTLSQGLAVIYSSAGALTGTSITAPTGTMLFVSGTDVQTNKVFLRGAEVTAKAAELNFNDGATAGTAVASKTVVLNSDKDITGLASVSTENVTGSVALSGAIVYAKDLNLGGTTVNSTAAELNYNNITTLGTAATSKALVLDTDLAIAGIGGLEADAITASVSVKVPVGGLTLGSTAVAATAAELDYTNVSAIGTAEASKALVLNSDKEIAGIYALAASHVTGTVTVSGMMVAGTTLLASDSAFTSAGTANFTSITASAVVQAASGSFINGLVAAASMQVKNVMRTRYLNISGTNSSGDGKEYQIEVVGGLLVANALN